MSRKGGGGSRGVARIGGRSGDWAGEGERMSTLGGRLFYRCEHVGAAAADPLHAPSQAAYTLLSKPSLRTLYPVPNPLPTLLYPHSSAHTPLPTPQADLQGHPRHADAAAACGRWPDPTRQGGCLPLVPGKQLGKLWGVPIFLGCSPHSCLRNDSTTPSVALYYVFLPTPVKERESVILRPCPQAGCGGSYSVVCARSLSSSNSFALPQVAVKRHGLSAQDYSNAAAAAGGPSTVGGRSRAPAAASGIGGGDGDSDADLGGVNSAILVAAADGTCTSFAPFMTEEAGDGAATRSSAAPRPPASVSASRRPSENSAILVAAADGTRVSFVPFIKEELSEELAGAALTAQPPAGAADGGPVRSSAADGGGRAAIADAAEGGGRAAMADAADRSGPSENSAIFVSPVDGSFAAFAPLRKSPPKR